ncbi:hypothetical protein GBF38_011989 [Nibea albiflora]|uniref:Uncharacterized protein n=1 Tax=Nibea albiflora TaxID=240163 RepID=A0ACB7EI58_NIBAL|nr:hypothetical protein GBF38_011989 [Nibea albiflora]
MRRSYRLDSIDLNPDEEEEEPSVTSEIQFGVFVTGKFERLNNSEIPPACKQMKTDVPQVFSKPEEPIKQRVLNVEEHSDSWLDARRLMLLLPQRLYADDTQGSDKAENYQFLTSLLFVQAAVFHSVELSDRSVSVPRSHSSQDVQSCLFSSYQTSVKVTVTPRAPLKSAIPLRQVSISSGTLLSERGRRQRHQQDAGPRTDEEVCGKFMYEGETII